LKATDVTIPNEAPHPRYDTAKAAWVDVGMHNYLVAAVVHFLERSAFVGF
jgi:hypothetical protein